MRQTLWGKTGLEFQKGQLKITHVLTSSLVKHMSSLKCSIIVELHKCMDRHMIAW